MNNLEVVTFEDFIKIWKARNKEIKNNEKSNRIEIKYNIQIEKLIEMFEQNKKGTRKSIRIAAAQEVHEAAKSLLELKNTR
tara:strand:+ start:13792 stop:14034 length:243 start_codon:yes stop_codon:yes gene_type:complete